MYTVLTLGVLYPEHSQLAFDCVIIACSLESIRPGLVQGCKAPNGVGSACFITSWQLGLPHWTWSVHLKSTPLLGHELCYLNIGPSQATLSLQIGVVLSACTDMWGAVTNTGYNSMPTSLGKVWKLIQCLKQGSVADKPPLTSQYPDISSWHYRLRHQSRLFLATLLLPWLGKTGVKKK